jgi:hypothetical protein
MARILPKRSDRADWGASPATCSSRRKCEDSPSVSSEVLDAMGKAITIARARSAARSALVTQTLSAIEAIATEGGASFATAVLSARGLYGTRSVDETGIQPLFDALDQARLLIAGAVAEIRASESTRAKVLLALSIGHQRLIGAITGVVLESVQPFSERLREIQQITSDLRAEVASAERKRAELERTFATNIDSSLPWGSRGTTEW